MKRAFALRRWAGVGVIWDATFPEPLRIAAEVIAPSPAPQLSLTVIHVQAGAVLSVGGVIFDPRILAVPQQRDAITEGETK